MTQDEIIRMAREAGFPVDEHGYNTKRIERFAAIVAAHEREKQAEQKPVAVVEITYGKEPECYVTGNIDDFPEGVFKLYAAPVRTKDLTDDEIYECYTSDAHENTPSSFARAVIAADREKNNANNNS